MAKQRNLFQFQPKYQTQLQYIVIKTADSLIDWLTLNTPVNLEFFLIGSFFHILFLLLFARKYVDKILSLVLCLSVCDFWLNYICRCLSPALRGLLVIPHRRYRVATIAIADEQFSVLFFSALK
jgi:hypothetical protein